VVWGEPEVADAISRNRDAAEASPTIFIFPVSWFRDVRRI
jgi:hypothetical protein